MARIQKSRTSICIVALISHNCLFIKAPACLSCNLQNSQFEKEVLPQPRWLSPFVKRKEEVMRIANNGKSVQTIVLHPSFCPTDTLLTQRCVKTKPTQKLTCANYYPATQVVRWWETNLWSAVCLLWEFITGHLSISFCTENPCTVFLTVIALYVRIHPEYFQNYSTSH